MTKRILLASYALLWLASSAAVAGGNNYKNFDVALYSRVYETQQMKDPAWLESRWEAISKNVKLDHIYLTSYTRQYIAVSKFL